MSFEDHLEACRDEDGAYDLAAATQARIEEILAGDEELAALAAKVAESERRSWERRRRGDLQKQLSQPALSPELELDVFIFIGDSVAVQYGDMTVDRIRQRMDLRLRGHIAETDAYNAEQTHWLSTLDLLDDDETIADALRRLDGGVG